MSAVLRSHEQSGDYGRERHEVTSRNVISLTHEIHICTAVRGHGLPCYGILIRLNANSSKCRKCNVIYVVFDQNQADNRREALEERRMNRWKAVLEKKFLPVSYTYGGRVA